MFEAGRLVEPFKKKKVFLNGSVGYLTRGDKSKHLLETSIRPSTHNFVSTASFCMMSMMVLQAFEQPSGVE